jgi:hypothetical protein
MKVFSALECADPQALVKVRRRNNRLSPHDHSPDESALPIPGRRYQESSRADFRGGNPIDNAALCVGNHDEMRAGRMCGKPRGGGKGFVPQASAIGAQ